MHLATCASTGLVLDETAGLLRVPLANLLAFWNPLVDDPWHIGTLTLDDLRDDPADCNHEGWPSHYDPYSTKPEATCRACQIRHIRILAIDGWPSVFEDPHPVSVDVGLGRYVPSCPVTDGNHRVAAAVLRGDSFVDLAVGGDWDRAVAVLVAGNLDALGEAFYGDC